MGRTILLQDDWSGGFAQDVSRGKVPPGKAWYIEDFLPAGDGAIRKRGGWSYGSPDFSTVTAGSAQLQWIHSTDVTGTSMLLAIDEDGNLFKVTSDSAATNVHTDATNFMFDALGYVVFINNGGGAPYKYDGTTVSAVGGSPPSSNALLGVGFGSYAVLQGGNGGRRLYFSAAGNIDSWDTTNAYLEVSGTIQRIATLSGMILAFQNNRIDAIIGSIPPPGGDFVVRPLWVGPGVSHRANVWQEHDKIYWTNPSGLFVTDGASVTNLTRACGISNYWLTTFASAPIIPVCSFRGLIFIGHNTSGLVIDPERKRAFGMTFPNRSGTCGFAVKPDGTEMYYGMTSVARLTRYSTIFSPSSTVKNEANGTAVTPELQTGYYALGSFGKKRFRNVYLTYDTRDAASDNPTFTVRSATSPELTPVTAVGTLAETTALTRTRLPIRHGNRGMSFHVLQNNASSDTYIYSLEAEVYGEEPFK